jgi:hypothetical protein
MTFCLTWTPRGHGEDYEKRILQLFEKWTPPAGFEFKQFFDYADGNGGVAIVEASSSEAIHEAMSPWGAFFKFELRPVIAVEKGAAILAKAVAWRDSIR